MLVGVPKEIKAREFRVGLTPQAASAYVRAGHAVVVESGAGQAIGFSDEAYRSAGARIAAGADEAWGADMVVKVKEPLPEEYRHFRKGLVLYAYLHLAADAALTEALVRSGATAIAYETVQTADGALPLLTPMSETAGRMAVQIGARLLETTHGGKGVLLGGLPGVAPARVVIIGGGTVGANAAKIAVGLGADVYVLDQSAQRLRHLDDLFQGRIKTILSDASAIVELVPTADLAIGAVLVPGAKAPKLVDRRTVERMAEGSVIVDVAVDQGGTFATIDRATTHDEPTYIKYGVVHYAVSNMPGAVPRTSTMALAGATTPYGVIVANEGPERAAASNAAIARGINVTEGRIVHPAVAEAHGLPFIGAAEQVRYNCNKT